MNTEVDTHAEANRAHFNQDASKYDARPMALKLAKDVSEFVTDKYTDMFDEDQSETVLMDYACGTGLISQSLATYVKKIVGVDISDGMVDYYNTRVANQGIDPDEMKAVCVELKGSRAPDELEGVKFDVVLCSMAYHHFRSIEETTSTLMFHLKPGGKLIIIDMIYDPSQKAIHRAQGKRDAHEHGHTHGHSHGSEHHHHEPSTANEPTTNDDEFPTPPPGVVVHHGGFTRERIEGVFQGAGLVELDWDVLGTFELMHGKGEVSLFCLAGTKPADAT